MNIEVGDRVVVHPDLLSDRADPEGRLRRAGVMTVKEIARRQYYSNASKPHTGSGYYYCVNKSGMVLCLYSRYLKKIRPSEGIFAGAKGGCQGGQGVPA